MKQGISHPLILLVVLSSFFVAHCQPSDMPKGTTELQGTITISGAWALYPLIVRWSEEFRKQHPAVEFDISAGGAGKGMADVLGGVVDIGMVSRPISAEEERRGAFAVPVARDAVFPVVNAQNPVLDDLMRTGVTRDILIDIYITGRITTWGQVVGRPEVSAPIHVYTRSDAAGAPETWANYLGKRQEDLLGIGVYGDPGLMEAVVKDVVGIGYNNLGYAFDLVSGKPVPGAVILPIDVNENGVADASERLETLSQARDAVARGLYPSPPARELFLVTRGKPSGATRTFIVWILNQGQALADTVGYVALSSEMVSATLAKLE
ncbi:MAG: substrate-binding domain-containing protein [Anaerolineae bacterium]|nr:substrate-binding domain-containing protein [Anaerolineae bacterium]MDW8070163.1 substrate-binding domain-containing protein [Anaerolineae bacterium]